MQKIGSRELAYPTESAFTAAAAEVVQSVPGRAAPRPKTAEYLAQGSPGNRVQANPEDEHALWEKNEGRA